MTTTGTIAQGTPVSLDTNLLLSPPDITHTAGSTDIILTEGRYLVEYTVVSSAPTSANVSVRFLLNSSTITGSITVQPAVTAGTFENLSSGFIIDAPNASNILQIAPDSSGGNIFNSSFANTPNISIRIVKLD